MKLAYYVVCSSALLASVLSVLATSIGGRLLWLLGAGMCIILAMRLIGMKVR